MALAITYTSTGGYIGINGGGSTSSWASAALATGSGLICMVPYGNGGTPTFGSVANWELATDGPPQELLLLAGQWAVLAWPNITVTPQVLEVTNAGAYVEGASFNLEVTGHDTAQMLGDSAAEVSGDGVLPTITVGAGNAVIASHTGSDTSSLYQGVGGSWNSPSRAMNSHANVGTSWNVTPNTGDGDVEVLSGVANAFIAFEVRAASGGGGGTEALSGSAMTSGQGSMGPNISIALREIFRRWARRRSGLVVPAYA